MCKVTGKSILQSKLTENERLCWNLTAELKTDTFGPPCYVGVDLPKAIIQRIKMKSHSGFIGFVSQDEAEWDLKVQLTVSQALD